MKKKLVALAAAASLSAGISGVALAVPSIAAPAAGISATQAQAYPVLHRGSQGKAVTVLQRLLNANGAKVAVDGSFGPATESAVKAYQGRHGLAVDATVGPATWSKLVPILKYGSRGASVTALQQSLGGGLKADGSFGPATRTAVIAFQRSRGLAQDGVAGPATWGALLRTPGDSPGPTPPVKGTWVAMNQRITGPEGDYSCGPTSVAMVLVGLGKTVPGYRGPTDYVDAVANLRRVAGTTPDGTGSDGMQAALTKYGARDEVTADTGRALAAVRSGRPVILNGYTANLPWLGGRTGHYIVVKGYDARTGQYDVLDPWGGKSVKTTAKVLTDFGESVGDPRGGDWRRHHIAS